MGIPQRKLPMLLIISLVPFLALFLLLTKALPFSVEALSDRVEVKRSHPIVKLLLPQDFLVSNSPETILPFKGKKVLQRFTLQRGRTSLLYFYHLNETGEKLFLTLKLVPIGGEATAKLTLSYLTGKNFMKVGNQLSLLELRALTNPKLKVFHLRKGKGITCSAPVKPGEIILGFSLIEVNQPSVIYLTVSGKGNEENLSSCGLSKGVTPPQWLRSAPMDKSHQRGLSWMGSIWQVLKLPPKENELSFYLGDLSPELILEQGWRDPLKISFESYKGAYGFPNLYTFLLDKGEYELIISPRGGKASLSAVIWKDPEETYIINIWKMRPYEALKSMRWKVRERTKVNMLVIPGGGSYLPVKFTIRANKQ